MSGEDFYGFAHDAGAKRRREVRRHGPRPAYGEDLTPEGIALIHEEARSIYADILQHDLGSIFYIVPSDVRRARDTRHHLEEALQQLAAEDAEHGEACAFVDFNDDVRIAQIAHDHSKRWIITGVPDIPEIGIDMQEDGAGPVWDTMQDNFREHALDEKKLEAVIHDLLSAVQVSWPSELPQLFQDIRVHVGHDVPDETLMRLFSPAQYVALDITPEDEVIGQLTAMHREASAVEEKFPGQHVHSITIGHAPVIDYVGMALMGQRITLADWKAYGGIRRYLEPIELDFDERGDMVYARLPDRGLESSSRVHIGELIAQLRHEAAARREAWAAVPR